MVAPLRPQPYTGTVVQPQPSSRPLFLRHFQPLSPPDPLDPILTHLPACPSQQRRDSPLAIAAVVRCQGNDGLCQCILVQPMHRFISLPSSPLPQQPAGLPLTHPISLLGTLHRTTPPLRAQKFPWATSRSTCFSSSRASSTVFSQLFPFVALTRFWGVCFRSQRLRLARLMGEFSDGFLTVVAATVIRYGLRSLLSSAIQSLRYQRLIASTCSRSSLPVSPSIHSVSVGIPSGRAVPVEQLRCTVA